LTTIKSIPIQPYASRQFDPNIACHVKVGRDWVGVDLATAQSLARNRTKRCEDCDGQVRVFQEGGKPAHMQHVTRHEGCPRSDVWEKGDMVRTRHPEALD